MPIEFLPLPESDSPEVYGEGLGEIRLTSFGMQVASNWSVGYLPAFEAAGAGGEHLVGSAVGEFAFAAQGFSSIDAGGFGAGWGVADLPAFEGWGLDDDVGLVPFDGTGDAELAAFVGEAVGRIGLFGLAETTLPAFAGVGFEAFATGADTDGYGTGDLPAFTGYALEEFIPVACATLIGPTPYILAWAAPTQGYLTDIMEVQESMVGQLVAALSDLIETTDAWASQAKRVALVSELLSLTTPLRIALEAVTTDTLAATDTALGTLTRIVAMRDALIAAGVVTSARAAEALIADAMALTDALVRVQDGEVTSDADMADVLSVLRHAAALVVEEATLVETLVGHAIFTVLVPDSFEADDSVTALATRLAAAVDGLDVAISFEFGGEAYLGLSMNTSLRGVTEYDNFAFDSLAAFDGSLYGANDDGVFLLEGEDDDGEPIDAFLRTAMQRVAQGQAASITDTYLGFRGNGQLQLKVVVANAATGGAQKAYVFDLVQSPAGAPLPGRFKVGKGLKSVYMAFELSNTEGADFAIDVMEVRPLVSYRRLS